MKVFDNLCEFVNQHHYAALYFIVDEKVNALFSLSFPANYFNIPHYTLVLPIHESAKNLSTAALIWEDMLKNNIGKNALIVNVGGGVVSDLGGFVAANYKRGVDFVNIPTTLLAMIDAAFGGKNGVNLQQVKNAIGTFFFPVKCFIDTNFLPTLSHYELLNGFAEMIKYALIGNLSLWNQLIELNTISCLDVKNEWITFCSDFKQNCVLTDPHDKNQRHILNFGHTVGHAFESWSFNNHYLSHGHAVAIGMIVESYLSYIHNYLSEKQFIEIMTFIKQLYPLPPLNQQDALNILQFCKQDKKNSNEWINITMLRGIGNALPNCFVTDDEVKKAFNILFNLSLD